VTHRNCARLFVLPALILWSQDILVQKLADNRHFQRFAVRTVETVQTAQKAVEEGVKDPAKVQAAGETFWAHFKAEVMRDVNRMGAQPGAAGRPRPGGGSGGSNGSGGSTMR
jgi:hypothetical protein